MTLAVLNFVTKKMIRSKPILFPDLVYARPKARSHYRSWKRLGLHAKLKHTKCKPGCPKSKTKQHVDSEIRPITKTAYGKMRVWMSF